MSDDLVKYLRNFCRSLVYKKLRFIAQNDNGVSLEDLENDLMCAALTALEKGATQNATHAKNLAKKSVHNHMVGLIEYHTMQKRQRVVSTVEGYEATTSSLEAMEQVGFVPTSLHHEDSTRDMARALAPLPKEIHAIINIVIGRHNEAFEAWLDDRNECIENLNAHTLALRACEYYEVPIEDLQQILTITL